MFSKDDLIIYGSTGVCKVRDICELKGSRDGRLYYKLEPVFDKCIIMVPADTKIFMRPVISRDEAIDLITKLPLLEISVPESRNNRQLSEYYKTSFTFHDCEELGTMINVGSSVYLRGGWHLAGNKYSQDWEIMLGFKILYL